MDQESATERFDKSKLQEIGFREIAYWQLDNERLTYRLIDSGPEAKALCEFPNVLYAFTCGEAILYVGKTTRGVRLRFGGYCKPGPTQLTNKKCNREIVNLLKENKRVAILVFDANRFLRYDIFEINLAAGLEDSIIERMRPRWNGKLIPGKFVSETSEIETEAAIPPAAAPEPNLSSESLDHLPKFEITLGKTYYNRGFINVPVSVANKLGEDGEAILIRPGEANHPGVESHIDRKANLNGTPRIYGGIRLAQWFQENFNLNGIVTAIVLTPNEILLRKNP